MSPRTHPVLLPVVLLALALRVVLGAPCCNAMAGASEERSAPVIALSYCGAERGSDARPVSLVLEHAEHPSDGEHGNHDDGDRSGICCSACEPALAEADLIAAARAELRPDYTAQFLRDVVRRAPTPAYQATGPPSRV